MLHSLPLHFATQVDAQFLDRGPPVDALLFDRGAQIQVLLADLPTQVDAPLVDRTTQAGLVLGQLGAQKILGDEVVVDEIAERLGLDLGDRLGVRAHDPRTFQSVGIIERIEMDDHGLQIQTRAVRGNDLPVVFGGGNSGREKIGEVMRIEGADKFIIDATAFARDGGAEACLKQLSDLGVHHVVLPVRPGFLWPGDMDRAGAAHFRRFLAGHRLRVVALDASTLGGDITAVSTASGAAGLEAVERVVVLAGELGAGGVIVGLDFGLDRTGTGQVVGHLQAVLDRLVRAAERAGTALWLAFPVSTRADAPELSMKEVMQLVDGYDPARIGVVYTVAEDAAEALRRIASRLALVRITVGASADMLASDVRTSPIAPLVHLPALLVEVGYRDWPALSYVGPDKSAGLAETTLAASIARLLASGFGRLPAIPEPPDDA